MTEENTLRITGLLHLAKSIYSVQNSSAQGVSFNPAVIDIDKIKNWLGHFSDAKTETSSTKSKWRYQEAISLPYLPESLAIIGYGKAALEVATVYQALGTKVSIFQTHEHLLPEFDADINKSFARYVKRQFKIVPKAKVIDLLFHPTSAEITFTTKGKSKPTASFDAVFQSEELDSAINRYGVNSDSYCVSTIPAISWAGESEQSLQQNDVDKSKYNVVNFPWRSLGRANTDVNTNGLTKLIFDTETDVLIGGGVMGINAYEVFQEVSLAIRLGYTADNIIHTVHAHPTLHESILVAAEVYKGIATDVINE